MKNKKLRSSIKSNYDWLEGLSVGICLGFVGGAVLPALFTCFATKPKLKSQNENQNIEPKTD